MKEWLTENWFSLAIAISSIASTFYAFRSARTAQKALNKENIELKGLAKKFGEYADTQIKFYNYSTRVIFNIVKASRTDDMISDEITIENVGGYGEIYIEPNCPSEAVIPFTDAVNGMRVSPNQQFKIIFSAKPQNERGYVVSRNNTHYFITVINSDGSRTIAEIGINEKGRYYTKNA
jgi:hypothetical protein